MDAAASLLREARSIAVFRALFLGDLLCALPALRALRLAAPRACISLIGLPWAKDFAARYRAYVDDFIAFPGLRGSPEGYGGARALRGFLREVRARRFDLAIQLHGSGAGSNRVVARFGAAQLAGFHPPDQDAPGAGFLPWRDHEHEVQRWLCLVQHLGAQPAGAALDWPVYPADRREAQLLLRALRLHRGAYVCVHPGARLASRRWPAQRFAAVCEALAAGGWNVVLTGSGGEAPLVRSVFEQVPGSLHARVREACGRTSLGALGALVEGARLLVSNDTGLSHVAAALGTPSVVVSSGGDARRWAPLDGARHRVLWQPLPCRPCLHETCPIGHPCALAVDAAQVIDAVQHLLQPRVHHAA